MPELGDSTSCRIYGFIETMIRIETICSMSHFRMWTVAGSLQSEWKKQTTSWLMRLSESHFPNEHMVDLTESKALVVAQHGDTSDCFDLFCSWGNNHTLIKWILICGSRFHVKWDLHDNQCLSRRKSTSRPFNLTLRSSCMNLNWTLSE